jgi:chaperonin GroES
LSYFPPGIDIAILSLSIKNPSFSIPHLNPNNQTGGSRMNVKPMEDRVLLKPMEAETKTSGGIIIPDNAKEKPQKGEVVAVGPGKTTEKGQKIEMSLKKGDKVLYGKYSGTEITIDGQEYLITRESDVLAII